MFNHVFKRIPEGSQSSNVCCRGKNIETIIRKRMNGHTDKYVILGKSQHSSEGVAKQVSKIKPADI